MEKQMKFVEKKNSKKKETFIDDQTVQRLLVRSKEKIHGVSSPEKWHFSPLFQVEGHPGTFTSYRKILSSSTKIFSNHPLLLFYFKPPTFTPIIERHLIQDLHGYRVFEKKMKTDVYPESLFPQITWESRINYFFVANVKFQVSLFWLSDLCVFLLI